MADDSFFSYGESRGLKAWLLSTDHKRVGILYLIAMLSAFGIGVGLGFTMRLKLMFAGNTIPWITPDRYNAMFTLHGVIMIFMFIIPGLPAVFGNFCLPLMIGARDVAFPRLNLASWYFFVSGAMLAVVSLFIGEGFADTGWTFYVPYSLRTGTNVNMALFAAFLIGCSSILTGLNFITTIHRLRCKGMTWFRMPLFPWALYATAWIQVLATPIIGMTLLLVALERVLPFGIFDPARGGDPILYQHLFWIYSHPAVYIMILPAMGAISEIIPAFSHRTIFGYRAIAISGMAIAWLGYFVWGHHMFTTGMSDSSRVFFSLMTFLVAVPSGVKVLNWVATLYKGSIEVKAPMLFALLFIFQFSIGGLTGLMQGALAANLRLHDTYFIVGHFHYVMFGGAGFAFFAALHYWFPKMFGRLYNENMARFSAAVMGIGFNVFYFPKLILGYMGMPRRYYDYLPQYQPLQTLATVGSWILVLGLILMAANLIAALFRGKKAPDNPWQAVTLEWQTSSPPPHNNFAKLPQVTGGAYEGYKTDLA
jgi:cytochrome c oxidase subunit I